MTSTPKYATVTLATVIPSESYRLSLEEKIRQELDHDLSMIGQGIDLRVIHLGTKEQALQYFGKDQQAADIVISSYEQGKRLSYNGLELAQTLRPILPRDTAHYLVYTEKAGMLERNQAFLKTCGLQGQLDFINDPVHSMSLLYHQITSCYEQKLLNSPHPVEDLPIVEARPVDEFEELDQDSAFQALAELLDTGTFQERRRVIVCGNGNIQDYKQALSPSFGQIECSYFAVPAEPAQSLDRDLMRQSEETFRRLISRQPQAILVDAVSLGIVLGTYLQDPNLIFKGEIIPTDSRRLGESDYLRKIVQKVLGD